MTTCGRLAGELPSGPGDLNLYPSELHPGFGTFVKARVDTLAPGELDLRWSRSPMPASTSGSRRRCAASPCVACTPSYGTRDRRRPHVVEAHIAYQTGLIAWPLAALLQRPLVLFAHGSDITQVANRSSLHRRLARMLLVAPGSSSPTATTWRPRSGGWSRVAGRLEVVSPGIELRRFRVESTEAEPRSASCSSVAWSHRRAWTFCLRPSRHGHGMGRRRPCG